jgi:hypothetical protein
MSAPETPEERAQRYEDARLAAAAALFDQYERWNDRGTFLDINKPTRCSTHNEQDCVTCCPRPRRRSKSTPTSTT